MLHEPKMPSKQMRHHFWVRRAPIQHRSRSNSAAAAPAPVQLSATQHLPASEHGAIRQGCCGVSPMLHAPHLPPKHMRHHFRAQLAPIKHCSRGGAAAAAPGQLQQEPTGGSIAPLPPTTQQPDLRPTGGYGRCTTTEFQWRQQRCCRSRLDLPRCCRSNHRLRGCGC